MKGYIKDPRDQTQTVQTMLQERRSTEKKRANKENTLESSSLLNQLKALVTNGGNSTMNLTKQLD